MRVAQIIFIFEKSFIHIFHLETEYIKKFLIYLVRGWFSILKTTPIRYTPRVLMSPDLFVQSL